MMERPFTKKFLKWLLSCSIFPELVTLFVGNISEKAEEKHITKFFKKNNIEVTGIRKNAVKP